MATEAIKSTAVTALDATPPTRTTTGAGSAGRLMFADGSAVFADTKTAGSTYQMVRIPSNAIVKRLWACIDTAVTTFTVDIGVYYSSGQDVTADLRGDALDVDLFGSAVALASIVVPTQYTMEAAAAALVISDMFLPIWNLAGLTSDPNCGIDIVMTNTATNDTTSTAYLAVEYIIPGA